MVAACQPARLVIGVQPGQVGAQVLGCYLADVNIAVIVDPFCEFAPIIVERAFAEGLCRFAEGAETR